MQHHPHPHTPSVPGLVAAGLTAVGLTAAALSTVGVTPAAAAPTAPGWVTGVVVDADGAPVADALVLVQPPTEIPEHGVLDETSDRWTTTDAEGRFRVRQAAQDFLVQVCDQDARRPWACTELTRSDYLLQYVGPAGGYDSWIEHTDLYDAAAADLAIGTIEVRPGATIRGTVAGAARERIQVMRLNDTMAYSTYSDAEGRYVLDGLAPGTYYVQAGGFGSLQWRSEPVTIDAARPTRVDGSLDRGTVLVGRMVDMRTDEPVARTDVFLADADGDLIASRGTTRTGSFRFTGLTPGSYQVGPLLDGGHYVRHAETVTVADGETRVETEVPVRRGASITVPFRSADRRRVDDELRDAEGDVIQTQRGRDGSATYTGLKPGTYTVVAADGAGYGLRTFRVRDRRAHTLRPLRLDEQLLTIRGRTAPGAVVEATTGNLCPPDAAPAYGGFHEIADRADETGRYVLKGLVPGSYMVAADAWPHNHAPICHRDVEISTSRRFDVPLAPGNTVSGRLVYEGTERPVITTLGYQLTYPAGQVTNPTSEHPSLDRTQGSSGRFAVTRVPDGAATGGLAVTPSDEVTTPQLHVLYPFQDGTPYWLEAAPQELDVQGDTDLGDVELVLGGLDPRP